jgi:hypothetical protein
MPSPLATVMGVGWLMVVESFQAGEQVGEKRWTV